MGVRVQISAYIISWPRMCACCLGCADDAHSAGHTRITGTRVIRSNSRSWEIPYCSDCLDHIEARAQAKGIYNGTAYLVLVGGFVAGALLAVTGSCCCAPFFGAGRKLPGIVGFLVASSASVATGIATAYGGVRWYRQLDAETKQRRRRAMQRAEDLATPTCCRLAPAVNYESWYGTVHTFWFANEGYARAFIRANPGKILG